MQSVLEAILALVIYPVNAVASTACPNLVTLISSNTYCTIFKVFGANRLVENLYVEAVSFHGVGSFYSNNNYRCANSTQFLLYVDPFSLPVFFGNVSHF